MPLLQLQLRHHTGAMLPRMGLVLLSVAVFLASTKFSAAQNPGYYGKYIGKLKTLHHSVTGEVFAVDARTLHIRDFTYDGEGPAAFFYAGNSKNPSSSGFRINDEKGSPNPLQRYRKKHVTITLPEGKTLNNIKWFSVWCDEFSVNFGDVKIPKNLDYPRPQKIDPLNGVHLVSSDAIVVVDAQTLLIPNFSYDGEAPDAKFWVGRGNKPSPQGVRVPDENGKEVPLRRYDRKTIVLTLPGDLTVFDIGHFGVWCEAFAVDFGHIRIPRGLNVPPSLKMLGVAPQSKLNCEVLWDDLAFEVRWAVAGESVVLQLVSKLEDAEYMAFGLSGDDTHSRMVGGDVAVAWVDKNTLKGYAEDYFLESKSQCSGKRGSCPDERFRENTNNVRLLNAAMVNGYSIVTYQRPLKAQDEFDRDIFTNGTQPIIWAIGPLNSRSEVSYHSLANKEDVLLEFGRAPKWNCPIPESDSAPAAAATPTAEQQPPPAEPVTTVATPRRRPQATPAPAPKNDAWDIPAIQCYEPEDGVFYAQMGPTGGKRGYPAITGHVGWGISWYINGLLIPEINVVRGKTYTFVVEGGLDPETPARYHPFYITDDPVGGYEHKTPEERAEVRVFAGARQNRRGDVYPTGTGRLCNWKSDPNQPPADEFASFGAYQRTLTLECDQGEPGIVQWTPDKNTPDTVYYQCFTHRYLGWKINVHDSCDTSAAGSDFVPVRVPVDEEELEGSEDDDDEDGELQSRPSIQVATRVKPNGVFINTKEEFSKQAEHKYIPLNEFPQLPSNTKQNFQQDFPFSYEPITTTEPAVLEEENIRDAFVPPPVLLQEPSYNNQYNAESLAGQVQNTSKETPATQPLVQEYYPQRVSMKESDAIAVPSPMRDEGLYKVSTQFSEQQTSPQISIASIQQINPSGLNTQTSNPTGINVQQSQLNPSGLNIQASQPTAAAINIQQSQLDHSGLNTGLNIQHSQISPSGLNIQNPQLNPSGLNIQVSQEVNPSGLNTQASQHVTQSISLTGQTKQTAISGQLSTVDPKRKPIIHATTPQSVLSYSSQEDTVSSDTKQEPEVEENPSYNATVSDDNTQTLEVIKVKVPVLPPKAVGLAPNKMNLHTTLLPQGYGRIPVHPQMVFQRPVQAYSMAHLRRPVPHRGFHRPPNGMYRPQYMGAASTQHNYIIKKPFYRPQPGRPMTIAPQYHRPMGKPRVPMQHTSTSIKTYHITLAPTAQPLKLRKVSTTTTTTTSTTTPLPLSTQTTDSAIIKPSPPINPADVIVLNPADTRIPVAVNTGFNPHSVVVEGGFKPIITSKNAEAQDRSAVVSEGEDEMKEVVKDATEQVESEGSKSEEAMIAELASEVVAAIAEEERKENPFQGQQPETFEPMFIPSPPDRNAARNGSDVKLIKKPILAEDLTPPIVHLNHRNSPQPNRKNGHPFMMIRPRPGLVRRPLFPNNIVPPFRIPIRGGSPTFRYQQSEEYIDDETPMAAERMDSYYLPPADSSIPPGVVVTYDGKSVADASLASSIPPAPGGAKNIRRPGGTADLIRGTPQFVPYRGEIPPPVPDVVRPESIPQLSKENQQQAQTLPEQFKKNEAFPEPPSIDSTLAQDGEELSSEGSEIKEVTATSKGNKAKKQAVMKKEEGEIMSTVDDRWPFSTIQESEQRTGEEESTTPMMETEETAFDLGTDKPSTNQPAERRKRSAHHEPGHVGHDHHDHSDHDQQHSGHDHSTHQHSAQDHSHHQDMAHDHAEHQQSVHNHSEPHDHSDHHNHSGQKQNGATTMLFSSTLFLLSVVTKYL